MRIRWTEPAARDLIGIRDYLEEHATKEIARRFALCDL
jgi:plasmid stabilization system protein ParE